MKKWYKVQFYAELPEEVIKSLDPIKNPFGGSLADTILKASKIDEFAIWDMEKIKEKSGKSMEEVLSKYYKFDE